MKIHETYFLIGAALLVLSILVGFWLGKQGAPYKMLPSTLHKLSAVVGIVLFILAYLKFSKQAVLPAAMTTLSIVTAVLLAAAIITGAIISNRNTGEGIIIRIHNAASIGSVISLLGLVIYYLRHT